MSVPFQCFCCTNLHLSGCMGAFRRSWHLFRVVSPDGCPGVKGPVPQPVSMMAAVYELESSAVKRLEPLF